MKLWTILTLALIWVGTATAQIYKWTDGNGVTHYSTTKPPPNRVFTEIETKQSTSFGATPSERLDRALNTYRATGINVDTDTPHGTRGARIKIGDWHSRLSPSGKYKYVEGSVSNISGVMAKNVRVKIKALDDHRKLVSLTEGIVDPFRLKPGQSGTFQVVVPNQSKVSSFDLRVLWD